MIIEFITNNKLALKYFPPVPAKKMLPEWYKNTPLIIEGINPNDAKQMVQENNQTNFTIKGCVPVLDYLTNGYIIRADADILITPENFDNSETAGFWWKSFGGKLETHTHRQCPIHINNKKNDYFKWVNSFAVKTPKGYSCYFYQPELFMENKFKLFPAIVDTDGYNMQPIHFPGVILTKDSFMIKAGDPIMVVFPFKRDDWQSKIRLFNKKENNQLNAGNPIYMFFSRGYKRLFNVKKNFD